MKHLTVTLFLSLTLVLWGDKEKDKEKKKEVPAPAAFMNCQACHLLNEVQVGPSLVEMALLYPLESADYFIEWCINPGKKRPDMAQMPSMAHIPREELAEIHAYILKVSKGLKPAKNYAKKDLFPVTERPRILRTFVPDASPASVVICLDTPEKHNVIWDTAHCRLRYISQGTVDNWPYVKSNGNSLATVGEIIYVEEAQFKGNPEVKFKGYRVRENGLPSFLYSVAGVDVTETIDVLDGAISRHIEAEKPLPALELKKLSGSLPDAALTQDVDVEITIKNTL